MSKHVDSLGTGLLLFVNNSIFLCTQDFTGVLLTVLLIPKEQKSS